MQPAAPEVNPWLVSAGLLLLCAIGASLAAWVWLVIRLLSGKGFPRVGPRAGEVRKKPPVDEWDEPHARGFAAEEPPPAQAERDLDPFGPSDDTSSRELLGDEWFSPIPPPPGAPRWRASTVLIVLGLYVAVQFVVISVFLEAVRVEGGGAIPASEFMTSDTAIRITTVINVFVALCAPPLIRWTSGYRLADLGLSPRPGWGVEAWIGAVLVLLMSPVVYGTFALAQRLWPPRQHPIFETIQEQGAMGTWGLALFSTVVAAPIAEELVFRGVLLGWLSTVMSVRSRANTHESLRPEGVLGAPNVLVSIVFAGLHFAQWPAPVPLFVLSLGLGWLALRTRGLVAPIVAHALFNGFGTVILLLLTQGGLKLPAG